MCSSNGKYPHVGPFNNYCNAKLYIISDSFPEDRDETSAFLTTGIVRAYLLLPRDRDETLLWKYFPSIVQGLQCTAMFCGLRVIWRRILIMKTRCTNYLWPLCSLQLCSQPHSDVMVLRDAWVKPGQCIAVSILVMLPPHVQVHWVHSFWCSLFAHFSPLCGSWPGVTPHYIKYSFYPADTLTLETSVCGFRLHRQ